MKKILFGFSMLLLPFLAMAQGVEGVIVEKYYTANQADHDASVAGDEANGVQALPVGAVTYRIYVDMTDDYELVGVHGNTVHTLFMRTSTFFYNNFEANATGTVSWNKAGLQQNVRLLDSYLAMGAASTQANTWGVLKAEDVAAGGTNLVFGGTTIANTANMPTPRTNDGLYTSTTAPSGVSFAGLSGGVFGDGTANGNLFEAGVGTPLLSGTWYSLNGASTIIPGNKVLIAQVTTDGRFEFAINVNVQPIAGGALKKYVVSNPLAGEIVLPSLVYDSQNEPIAPTCALTATPASGRLNSIIALSATPADANGIATISGVEFFAGATSLGVDNTAPYTMNYTLTANTTFTAVATDNGGLTGTSAPVSVNIQANTAPVISAFVATPATVKVGRAIAFSASITDDFGPLASVVFTYNGAPVATTLAGNVYSGTVNAVLGQNNITVAVMDSEGLPANGSASVSVVTNPAPVVTSVSVSPSPVAINNPATLSAVASDDESVASIVYSVNGTPIAGNTWTPTTEGNYDITAVATDNQGLQSAVSAAVRVNAFDPSATPYQITSLTKKCSAGDLFFIPVVALKPIANVIGFDMVMKFDPTKVLPTNVIVLNNDLIDSTKATATLSVAGDSILIQVSLNSNALEGDFFSGALRAGGRQVVAVEFAKTNNFAPVDVATFSIRKLEESYYSGVLRAPNVGVGTFTTYKDYLFNGSLKFWNGNDGMGYTAGTNLITKIFGNINLVDFVTPDLNGNFIYDINRGQSISIRRDIADLSSVQSVINGMDGLLTQKVLLDDASFKPSIFQAVAMDVNIDGRISAGDLSQISQRSVRRLVEYKQAWNYNDNGTKIAGKGLSKDWLFISDSTLASKPSYLISATFPSSDNKGFSKYFVPKVDTLIALPIQNYATCPIISGQTFRGVLLGDVNGSYKSLGSSVELKSAKAEVIFDMANAIETEGTIEVPVYVASSEAQALDFTITVSDNLEFAGIDNKVDGNYVVSSFEGSKEVSLFSFGKYSTDKASVVVRFNKLGAVSASDLAINAAYINGKKVGAGISTKVISNEVKIYPNPASKELNVMASEASKVQILDLNGKVVVEGLSSKSLNVEGLSSGVYMVKVSNKTGVKTQKVVIK